MASLTGLFERRVVTIGTIVALFCVSQGQLVRAQIDGTPKSGNDFSQTWEAAASFTWSEQELLAGIRSLEREKKIAFFLDRRIDPQQKITFSVRDLPLREAIEQLAERLGLSCVDIEGIVYLGPSDAAGRVIASYAKLRAAIAQLPAEEKKAWLELRAAQWKTLSTPQELLLERMPMKLAATSPLPHDLWREFHGPACTNAAYCSLVLAGFDKSLELVGGECRLVSLPMSTEYERSHRVSGDLVKLGKEIKKKYPDLVLKREGTNRITFTASHAIHCEIAQLASGKPAAPVQKPAADRKRYTLDVENKPLGAVLKTLADERGLKIAGPPGLEATLKKLVSLTVRDETFERILEMLLQPEGLTFTVQETTLTLRKLGE